MSYIPLINELSELDKERIKNYLYLYGNRGENIPLEEWLKYWEHSNQKLYKALGNTLIKEIPNYKIEKNDDIIKIELNKIKEDFYRDYCKLVDNFIKIHLLSSESLLTVQKYREILKMALNYNNLLENKFNIFLDKIKIKLADGKIFQLQKGMKIIKVINKIFDACKNYECMDELVTDLVPSKEEPHGKEITIPFKESFLKNFNNFTKKYSIILNEKYIEGTLCFSIHPLDYLTMSDNSLRWSSCMSWADDGCYRVGTIEMMNSNNVICAYLKDDTSFNFSKKNKKEESYFWNNKRWRQLFYVTKDIIVNGKSYPFAFDDFTQSKILMLLVESVKENLKWDYEYGPESYMDMIHIHSKYRMDRNREWIRLNDTFKHNILFNTNGMYNDLLNDIDFPYLCVRNKVKKNKIISVSGKANCICCNNNLLEPNLDNTDNDYNEQFIHANRVLCEDCMKKVPVCDECFLHSPMADYVTIIKEKTGEKIYLCKECFANKYKKCPFCSNIFNFEEQGYLPFDKILFYEFKNNNNDYDNKLTRTLDARMPTYYCYLKDKNLFNDEEKNILMHFCCCPDCAKKIKYKEQKIIPYHAFIIQDKNSIKEESIETININIVLDNELIEQSENAALKRLNNITQLKVIDLPHELRQEYKFLRNIKK